MKATARGPVTYDVLVQVVGLDLGYSLDECFTLAAACCLGCYFVFVLISSVVRSSVGIEKAQLF